MTYTKQHLFVGFKFLYKELSYEIIKIEEGIGSTILKANATGNTFNHSLNDIIAGLNSNRYTPIYFKVIDYEIF